MRKILMLLLCIAFILTAGSAYAFLEVPSYGNTGWQHFELTLDDDFYGAIGWVVSDEGDNSVASYLLLDNITIGSPAGVLFSEDFEGSASGWLTEGSVSLVTTSAYSSETISAMGGSYMAELFSVDGDSGFDTSIFGYDGTDGSLLYMDYLQLGTGTTISFDWLFATEDYTPYKDFSLFAMYEGQGDPTGPEDFVLYELGTIGGGQSVPEPSTMLLLGTCIFGIVGASRRKIKK